MRGRAFLEVGQRLASRTTEPDWRTAAGRAYYSLYSECRSALISWGVTLPRRDQAHAQVRLRFTYAAEPDLQAIGMKLEELGRLRNLADYQLELPGQAFVSPQASLGALEGARTAIARLDEIEGDAKRRAAAIAAIQATKV